MTSAFPSYLELLYFRFPEYQLLTHLSVLGLRPISFLSESELHDWGNDSIQNLADFYGKSREHTYKDPKTNTNTTSRSDAVLDAVQLMVTVMFVIYKNFQVLMEVF